MLRRQSFDCCAHAWYWPVFGVCNRATGPFAVLSASQPHDFGWARSACGPGSVWALFWGVSCFFTVSFHFDFRCCDISLPPPLSPMPPFWPYSNFVCCRAVPSRIDSSHFTNNIHSYNDETFYWEIVLTARKVGIVAISVFGRVIGAQRQAQVALLILFLCISLEIAARPYKMATERHKVLDRLELAALFSLWGTMWCGTLIFASQSPVDEGFIVFLSLLVLCINIGMLVWLIYRLAAACLFENKDTKVGRFLMQRTNTLRKQASWREPSRAKKIGTDGVQIELTSSAGVNALYTKDTKAQRSTVAVETEAVELKVVNPLYVSNSSGKTGESKWEIGE